MQGLPESFTTRTQLCSSTKGDETLVSGKCGGESATPLLSQSASSHATADTQRVRRHSHEGDRAEQGEAFSGVEHLLCWLCLKASHVAGQALNFTAAFLFLKHSRMLLSPKLPARQPPSKKLASL